MSGVVGSPTAGIRGLGTTCDDTRSGVVPTPTGIRASSLAASAGLNGTLETIEQGVSARMERQRLFARRPAPLLSFVIDEHVLQRPLGGRGVWRGQLEQLLIYGHQRNVAMQVMPMEREEHAGLAGPFTLIHSKDQRRMAYMEVQDVSALYAEPKRSAHSKRRTAPCGRRR
ncbi:Scr1 family TA system antitoxin-like transcriptional regulator [Streptomyces aureus]